MNPASAPHDRLALRDWYASPPGEAIADDVVRYLNSMVPQLFGYHALRIGDLGPERDTLEGSRIIHRVRLDLVPPADVLAQPRALPVAADTLDLVVLTHVLEFCADPHAVLREVDRTLVPEGHVIVIGFNPISFMGLRRLAAMGRGTAPWHGRYYTHWRVKDWLKLLGYDVLDCVPSGFRPPLRHAGVLRRLRFMETLGARFWPILGSVYVILARKRVVTLTPVRPRWRPRRRIAAGLAGSGLRRQGRG
ncbi:methyltransferase type 11 [Thioalkalivibrio denitrificans]|uniref:Methyltransferase type 11 n=1 Tax=Thioalkalivibrio denitrificans TaxID=108003 RepID=A0A1V3NVF5_9GAMM|nr:methyltransferase domain-containing protein [Thioalkalivibrio denitrificans]OOG28706.1 methyltransferase type 11 [Thioalkalivibrio denitrificans]